jgi:hypothetical protein
LRLLARAQSRVKGKDAVGNSESTCTNRSLELSKALELMQGNFLEWLFAYTFLAACTYFRVTTFLSKLVFQAVNFYSRLKVVLKMR